MPWGRIYALTWFPGSAAPAGSRGKTVPLLPPCCHIPVILRVYACGDAGHLEPAALSLGTEPGGMPWGSS